MLKSPRVVLLMAAIVPLVGPACSSTAERTAAQRISSVDLQIVESQPAPVNPARAVVPAGEASPEVSPVSYADADGVQHAIVREELAIASDEAVPTPAMPLNPLHAESPAAGLTLAALEDLALQNNPSIQQANAAAAKAAGIQTQVGLKPNPTIGYFGDEIGNEGAGGMHGAFVSQTFVRGDKLAWNQQVLGHEFNALLWQVHTQRQRVLTDIRVQYYAALVAQRRVELAREFREVADKGVQVSEDRLRIQVGTRPDLLQSEMQLNEVDLLIQRAELDLDAAWNQLAATAGLPHLALTQLVGDLEIPTGERDAEAVYQQIVSTSPLLSAARARVDRARSNLQRQNVQAIPNLTAQLGAGHDDATGDEFANVQLSLPLPIHNKNQGNVRAAYAEFCEATQNVQRLTLQVRRDLADVMREYQVAQVTVKQYEDSILPKAAESLDLIQQALVAGQIDFLRVLTARRMFFDVNLEYVEALGELAQANAKLDGLLLTGGLENVPTYDAADDLRGQALSNQ